MLSNSDMFADIGDSVIGKDAGNPRSDSLRNQAGPKLIAGKLYKISTLTKKLTEVEKSQKDFTGTYKFLERQGIHYIFESPAGGWKITWSKNELKSKDFKVEEANGRH